MPNSSSDDWSSDSMEEKEKRFYSRPTPAHQPPPSTSSSQSLSLSESDGGSPPQKNPKPSSTNRNVAAKPNHSNSTKRAREEEQSPGLENNKKLKEVKKTPPWEASKQSEKKTSEDKKWVKKSESPPKSAEKNGHLWNVQDEISFLKGVVAYQAIKGMPRTITTPVFDHVRNLNVLEHEYSNNQMYDKLSRLKMKFTGLKDKVNVGDFTFKIPHDEMVYKIGEQIWGNGEEEEEEEEEDGESTGEEDEKNGDEDEENGDEEVEEDDEEEEDNEEDDESTIEEDEKNDDEGVEEDEKKGKEQDFEMVHKEEEEDEEEENLAMAMAMMNEFEDDLAIEKQKFWKEIMKMVREALRSSVSSGASDSVQFSSEEMIKRISSSRELPALEKAEADRLEHKWQRQHLIELDVYSKHLLLLQEECQLRMEKLRSQVEGKNP